MLNLREIPFVRWLLPFLGGILLAIFLNREIPFLFNIVLVLLFIVGIAYFQRGWYRYGWILDVPQYLFFLALGYLVTWNHNELTSPNHFSHHLQSESLIVGKIVGMPIEKKWIRLELSAKGIRGRGDLLKTCSGNLLVYIEKDSLSKELCFGELIGIKGAVKEIDSPKNPKAFDFKKYLYFQNIHYQSFVKNDEWVLLEKDSENSFLSIAINLRSQFLTILRKYLPSPNEFSVGSALILGHKDEISEEIRTAYANTGAMHVLAVSGLHVGIIYLLLQFLLLKRIKSFHPIWKAAKILIPLFGIWAFALITGMPPSVKRAATMFSFFIIGGAFQRDQTAYNILAASAFWLLLFDPFLIMQVSFQLSYFAVVGIVYFQPKMAQLWLIKNRVGNYLWQLSCVSMAAQLATFPLGLYYFHQFPLYFWLSGLVVVPAAFLILLGGISLFLLEAIFSGGGAWIGDGLYYLIKGVNWAVFYIQNLPGSVILGIWISASIAFLIYLILSHVAIAINTKNFRWLLTSLGILVFVSLSSAFTKMEHYKNRKVVIYNIYRHSAIDCFDGTHLYALVDKGLQEKTLNFATQNNRWAEGVTKTQTFVLNDTTNYVSPTFWVQNQFFQFHDRRFAIISQPLKNKTVGKLPVNYVLIRNNSKIYMEDILANFEFDLLLFDASNANWRVEKWKSYCDENGLSYYDINKEGAWVLDLEE